MIMGIWLAIILNVVEGKVSNLILIFMRIVDDVYQLGIRLQ